MLGEKRWEPEAVLRLGIGLFFSLLIGSALATAAKSWVGEGSEASRFLPFVISTLSFHGMILVLTQVFLWRHGVGWSEAFGFREPGQNRAVLLAVGATVVALPVALVLGHLCSQVMLWLKLNPVAQQAVTTVQTTTGTGRQVYLAVMAVGLAPVAEEILFRGILYPTACRLWNSRVALWGTSVAFGAFHANLMTFLPLTFLGAMLAWLYGRTGNLLAPILAHSLFNLANFFFLVLQVTGGSV